MLASGCNLNTYSTPRGSGGTLIFSSYEGSGPASTVHPPPPKKKQYEEFQAPQNYIWYFGNPKKYIPDSVPWPLEKT